MRKLCLFSLVLVFAAPVLAGGTEATVYLAPRERGALGLVGFDQAPSDVESPPDWRRDTGGSEETDHLKRSSQ